MVEESKDMSINEILRELIIYNAKIRHVELDPELPDAEDFNIGLIDRIVKKNMYMDQIFQKGTYRLKQYHDYFITIIQRTHEHDTEQGIPLLMMSALLVQLQLFGDGNHRTTYYLITRFFNVNTELKKNKLITYIDSLSNYSSTNDNRLRQVDYSGANINKFILKLRNAANEMLTILRL